MNISDSMGESSSKRQENGDAPSGSERPLKKARFAWQVKGKYHLKNEVNDAEKSSPVLTNELDKAGTSVENEIDSRDSRDLVGSTEQNLEILGDYLLKQDFNTLDSVIADDKSLLKPNTNISQENYSSTIQYVPRYVSSYENNVSYKAAKSSFGSNDNIAVPMSMIMSHNYCEDQCIARWQARQMAKGFVDNTINRVLDSWANPPRLPEINESRFLALDIAEFINNLPGDNTVENEGILMAISAHGLQNTSSSTDDNATQTERHNTTKGEKKTYQSPPSSPLLSDEDTDAFNSNKQSDMETSSSSEMCWPYVTESGSLQNENMSNELSQFSFFPGTSIPCQSFSDSENLQGNSSEFDTNDDVPPSNHYDFMDTAVTFAILNKGLTTFGTDYG
ncbi:uncharacterized protein LOC113510706 [Galleria mellonella]|uniref:Uncharacterized protein LOC113510706 n=1 Tax=Galleria mellonella TaxID=7137 RepID=A0A6J1WA86_GALME|nr:uncharacterized protein LOC113510706 [Galleria mellonella]